MKLSAAKELVRVVVGGLCDPSLERAIKSLAPKTVLFTSGGIVPPSLTSCPDTRFMHVHAGRLPHVRGADGVRWSMLVRGRPWASRFFMGEALDTGPVLRAQDYPAPTFKIPGVRPDAIPCPLLILRPAAARRPAPPSPSGQHRCLKLAYGVSRPIRRVTYNFMHDALRRKALSKLFRKESSS